MAVRLRGAVVCLGCYLLCFTRIMGSFEHADEDRAGNVETETETTWVRKREPVARFAADQFSGPTTEYRGLQSDRELERDRRKEDDRKRLCSRDEVRDGSWVPITLQKPPYISKTTHLRCYPLEAYKTGRWDTFDWKPSSTECAFSKWSRSQFCSLMERATIMIAGDSLSWEHYSSLAQQLGVRVRQTSQHTSKLLKKNHVQLGCHNKVRLVFRRDDLLTNLTGALEETHPQILVINRGAHHTNDTRLIDGIHRVIGEVRTWKKKCRDLHMKCHLFWRTSVPGHPRCDKFEGPVNDLAAMEAWVGNRSNYNDYTLNYQWFDYQRQNELVIDTLQRHIPGEFDILDAYYLNILRPDEHRAHQGDCLHNCYPGKVDVYSRLLFHFLKMRRTEADRDALVNVFEAAAAAIARRSEATA